MIQTVPDFDKIRDKIRKDEQLKHSLLSMSYGVPVEDMQISGLDYGEIDRRLMRAQDDDAWHWQPESYAIGWLSSCNRISAVDAAFDALPEDSPDEDIPETPGSLAEYARYMVARRKADRYRAFLYGDDWTDANRCELATWQGRADCAECACQYLRKVDNNIQSTDLAKILRRYSSIGDMQDYIVEAQSIAEADHRLCVIGGAL